MLYRVRRQLVEEGFEAVLSRKQRYRHRIRAGFKKFGRGPFPARQNRRAGPGQSQYPQQGAPSPKRNGWSSAWNGITRPTLFGGDTPFGTTVGSI
jgi:hypothetical protein